MGLAAATEARPCKVCGGAVTLTRREPDRETCSRSCAAKARRFHWTDPPADQVTEWIDTGCHAFPSCLRCPLPVCLEDAILSA